MEALDTADADPCPLPQSSFPKQGATSPMQKRRKRKIKGVGSLMPPMSHNTGPDFLPVEDLFCEKNNLLVVQATPVWLFCGCNQTKCQSNNLTTIASLIALYSYRCVPHHPWRATPTCERVTSQAFNYKAVVWNLDMLSLQDWPVLEKSRNSFEVIGQLLEQLRWCERRFEQS